MPETPCRPKVPAPALRILQEAEELRRAAFDLLEQNVDPVIFAQTLADAAASYQEAADAIVRDRTPCALLRAA